MKNNVFSIRICNIKNIFKIVKMFTNILKRKRKEKIIDIEVCLLTYTLYWKFCSYVTFAFRTSIWSSA